MMQFKVEIAEQAEEDINEKGFYIANDLASPDTAKKTVAEIRKKIASLSYGPFYPVYDVEPWKSQGVRFFYREELHSLFYG